MTTQPSTNGIPSIRTFQFDNDGIGAIRNSVNLFRGDVNLSLNLITLPSRNGLDVNVDALYGSNVQDRVDRWNLEAPTGILGLGWSLPFDRIEVDLRNTGSLEDNRYFFLSNDSPSLLLRSTLEWRLFDTELDRVEELPTREVDARLREAFARNSIPLSFDSRIEEADRGELWRIFDNGNERAFNLRREGDRLEVFDGGIGFELQDFQFWKVRYYPIYERWLIVKESGLMFSFGGGLSERNGVKRGARGGIQWGVRWGNWIGSSTLTENQERYARAWNLVSVANNWGDRVSYAYATVEQEVGDGGLPYTKAVYLETITDVFDRKVRYHYREKEFVENDPAGPREFLDPHRPVPSNAPNAFQDRYETRYLEAISVEDREGELLYTLRLGYELHNVTDLERSDPLYGDTTKRYLTALIQENAQGEALPGIDLDYYLESTAENPGGLRSVTYPQGGKATYTYEKRDLPICDRSLQIDRPEIGPVESWVPRTWFGPDYAVVAWYNTDSTQIRISVYTWIGFWYEWHVEGLDFRADLNLDTLNVLPGADSFALSYELAREDRTTVLLFHKQANALGQWILDRQNIGFDSLGVRLAFGEEFLIAVDERDDAFRRYTWNWQTKIWDGERFDLKETFCASDVTRRRRYFITARSNYYLVLCYDDLDAGERRSNTLRLFYLDELSTWHHGDTIHPNDLFIAGFRDAANFHFSPADSFTAATAVTRTGRRVIDYDLYIFQWNADYTFLDPYVESLRIDRPVPFVASVVQNSLVGSGPFLFRYNGVVWERRDLDIALSPSASNVFWSAYGPDLALLTENGADQIISSFGVYDPNTDSQEWDTEPRRVVDLGERLPFRQTRYFPTAGSDYVTLDKKVYFRGLTNDWLQIPDRPIHVIPAEETVNTTTMQNQAPGFLAYLEGREEGSDFMPTGLRVLNLRNGRVANVEAFAEQIFQIYELNGRLVPSLNGKVPAGPSAFFTFPLDEGLNDASHITLRRHLENSVEGTIADRRVRLLLIDGGYDRDFTSFGYDESTAVCDPSGTVVKYFRASALPGCEDGEDCPFGRMEMIYINGLPGDMAGVDYGEASELNNAAENYSVLDGFIERRNLYDRDGELVAFESNDWLVKTEIETGGDPSRTVAIRGAYVIRPRVVEVKDRVSSSSLSTFDLSSRLIVATETTNYNSCGVRERRINSTTYGYQEYEVLRALNVLNPTVQIKREVQEEGAAEPIPISVDATRLKPWPKRQEGEGLPTLSIYDEYESYRWLGGEGEAQFTAFDPAVTPSAAWFRTEATVARSNQGLVIETTDGMDRVTSILYDRHHQYEVATFVNAALLGEEADYLGFEAYEQDLDWRITPAGGSWTPFVVSDQAHAGKRSLKLSAATTGPNGLEKTFRPAAQDGKYLFSAWMKTEEGFVQEGEQAGWTLTIRRDGEPVERQFVPFVGTGNAWRYFSRALDLAPHATGGALEITIRAANPTAKYALIDDLRLSAFVGEFAANVYDSRYALILATLGPNHETDRNVYDDFQRQVATVGPDENVGTITPVYLSRQDDRAFRPDDPNRSIALESRTFGYFADFRRDGAYRPHWTSPTEEQWRVRDGVLLHEGDQTGRLTLVSPAIEERYGAHLLVRPLQPLTNPLGLDVGDRLTVEWRPSTGRWQLQDRARGRTLTSARRHDRVANGWLLLVYDRTVLFFADGEQIFAYVAGDQVTGRLSIFAGDRVAFRDIAIPTDPLLAVSYMDGAANERQRQALCGEESLVSGTVYDPVGRAAVKTKPARLSPPEGTPLLAYRPGFIELPFDWISGVMQGEISTYYSAAGGGFSDDQGYPYSRQRYEPSPLGRVIERGLPGRSFAIVDLDTTRPEERHTTKAAYSANRRNGFLDELPAGEYFATTATDPDGRKTIELRDRLDNRVAKGTLTDPANRVYATTSYRYLFSRTGRRVVTLLPNYYAPPDPALRDRWQNVSTFDMLGRKIEIGRPDSGRIEMIYDRAGALRFSQDTRGRDEGYYLYARYDAAERVVESGYLAATFDRRALQAYADDDPSFPPSPPTWEKRFTYDGDGSDPTLVSRLRSTTVATNAGDGTAANREIRSYDVYGNVIRHTTRLLPENASFATRYEYDNLRNVTRTEYPRAADGDPPQEVRYRFNQIGLLRSIGDGEAPEAYAAYTYNANGSVRTEVRGRGSGAEVERGIEYLSPGWLRQIEDPFFLERNFFIEDQAGNPGYFSGLIAETACRFQRRIPAGVTPELSYRYTYDNLKRLTVAENRVAGRVNPAGSVGLGAPITYDDNGNFRALQRGETLHRYTYYAGTNEVRNTTGGTASDYLYDPDGNVSRAVPRGIREIRYNRLTGRTEAVRLDSGEVLFEYNARDQRLSKRAGGAATLYLHGLNDLPLVERITGGESGARSLRYVYGLTGLLGWLEDGRFSVVLPDRLGSIRAVIDDAGTAEAAYNYFPFGGFLDPPGAEGTALTYLFTGQELDRELSLYNFRARFYDSDLGRFYATDPQQQFASPYVYGADNPILFVDPSGEIALGAILGIALGGLAVIGGAVLTIATGGGALPVEAGTVTAFVAEIAAATVGGAVLEAGTASVVYSATHPDDWNRNEFGISVGVAAGAGAFAGGFGVATGAVSQAIGKSASAANRLGSSARARIAGQGTGLLLEGAAAGATNLAIQLAENSSSEGSLGSGLGEAFALGLLGGALAIGGERAFDRGVDKLLTRRGVSADKGLKAGLAIGATSGTLLGVPTNVVAQVITNAASGESVDSELLQAAALGAVSGVISGGIRAVGTYATQGSQGLGSAPGAPDLALQDFNPPPSIDSQTS